MTTQQSKKSVIVRMSESDVQRLDQWAEERRTSREALIRECIVEKLAKMEA